MPFSPDSFEVYLSAQQILVFCHPSVDMAITDFDYSRRNITSHNSTIIFFIM